MFALKSIDKKSLINYEDLLFVLIDKHENSDLSQLYYVDAIIINSINSEVYASVLSGIRKHYNPNIYLKPIFAVENENAPRLYQKCCDQLTDPYAYELIAERTRFINKRISKLFQLQRFPNPEKEFLYKILQFLYTRDAPLHPIPHRFSKINFHYPFLSWQFADSDVQKLLKIVETGKREGLLSSKLVDKIHMCNSCGSAHHNIRETCSSCQSIDLEVEDLIHHFQCAYVGPESDFKQPASDVLTCPKCSKVVRHIGIDYDKPSHIYRCRSCNASFQDAQYTYSCMDCNTIKDVRHLEEQGIEELYIASKGIQLVIRGFPNSEETDEPVSNTVTGIYSWDVFQHLLKQEEARASQQKIKSILGRVAIFDDSINQLSSRDAGKLQNELARVLKSYMRDFDMICPKSLSQYYFILTNTTQQEAEKIKDMIAYNFGELLKGNIENSDPEINVELIQLDQTKDVPPSPSDLN